VLQTGTIRSGVGQNLSLQLLIFNFSVLPIKLLWQDNLPLKWRRITFHLSMICFSIFANRSDLNWNLSQSMRTSYSYGLVKEMPRKIQAQRSSELID